MTKAARQPEFNDISIDDAVAVVKRVAAVYDASFRGEEENVGGRMTYRRFLSRNRLHGEFGIDPYAPRDHPFSMIRGDLRRLERDSRDGTMLRLLSKKSGATPGQVERVLNAFFEEDLIG